VDLTTGAILAAEVRKADEADTQGLAERTISAASWWRRSGRILRGPEPVPEAAETLTGDKGYYCVEELESIQQCGIKTVISESIEQPAGGQTG